MHFVTDAVPREIQTHMIRLVSITGWKPWEKRVAWLREQVRVNPTMPYFVEERFGLELAFARVRQHYDKTGRYTWPPKSAEQVRLYSFLAMIVRCHQRLRSEGKKRLSGMLVDALKGEYGLASLAFEMKVVAHLMARGFDVEFHDIEEGGGFDFLASNDDVEMEVECKFVSGDIGRQIHLKRLHQLGTVLLPEMTAALEDLNGGRLIRISIPGRLGGTKEQHDEIRRFMSQAIADPKSGTRTTPYKISVLEFSIGESPFGQLPPDDISLVQVQRFLSDNFNIDNKNVLINFSPKQGAVLVVVESQKKDAVLKGIHHQLKDKASKQFSGDRPGILCCQLADVTDDQLRSLKSDDGGGTGLDFMVSDLMKRRPLLHTVSFTSVGTVEERISIIETTRRTSTQVKGVAYTFENPEHPMAGDPRYEVF